MALNAAAKCHNQFLTSLLTLFPKFNIQLQLLDVIGLEAVCLILPLPSIPSDCYLAPSGVAFYLVASNIFYLFVEKLLFFFFFIME